MSHFEKMKEKASMCGVAILGHVWRKKESHIFRGLKTAFSSDSVGMFLTESVTSQFNFGINMTAWGILSWAFLDNNFAQEIQNYDNRGFLMSFKDFVYD